MLRIDRHEVREVTVQAGGRESTKLYGRAAAVWPNVTFTLAIANRSHSYACPGFRQFRIFLREASALIPNAEGCLKRSRGYIFE